MVEANCQKKNYLVFVKFIYFKARRKKSLDIVLSQSAIWSGFFKGWKDSHNRPHSFVSAYEKSVLTHKTCAQHLVFYWLYKLKYSWKFPGQNNEASRDCNKMLLAPWSRNRRKTNSKQHFVSESYQKTYARFLKVLVTIANGRVTGKRVRVVTYHAKIKRKDLFILVSTFQQLIVLHKNGLILP